jgi:hypothetical protein
MTENLPVKAGDFSLTDYVKRSPSGATDQASQELLERIGKEKGFVSSVRLLQGGSREVKAHDADPQAKAGKFIWDGQYLESGIQVLLLVARPKAIRFENNEFKEAFYDSKDPRFVEYMNFKGKEKAAGPEFLCWFPEYKGFALLHLTKSALNNLGDFETGYPLELYSKYVKHKGNEWYVPRARPLKGADGVVLTPETASSQLAMPSGEQAKKNVEKFLDPDSTKAAGVTPSASSAAPPPGAAR